MAPNNASLHEGLLSNDDNDDDNDNDDDDDDEGLLQLPDGRPEGPPGGHLAPDGLHLANHHHLPHLRLPGQGERGQHQTRQHQNQHRACNRYND